MRVEQRRRGRKWRIVVGVAAVVAVIVLVVLAFKYKGRPGREEKGAPPPETAATAATVESAATAEELPPVSGHVVTLLVNGTSVPQRFGNALAALEEFNAASGEAIRFEQYRPRITYSGESVVYYRAGFETWAEEMAAALGAELSRERVDMTVICGQDISKLILEALAKNVPAPEDTHVEVLNGCGIEGAAGKMRERLEANGYVVVAVGNAATFDYRETVIEVGEDRRDAALRAAALFGLDEDRLEPHRYDVKIIIGDDYVVAAENP